MKNGMKKITLIGTGHVFDLSAPIKEIIESAEPDVVCVELDERRLEALMSRLRGRGRRMPSIYRLLAMIQENIASRYGVEPGSEMISGIEAAKKCGAKIECIDMDAQSSIEKIWKKTSLKEKIGLIIGSMAGIFVRKRAIEREMEAFEREPNKYISKIGTNFPIIKEVLIDERNEWMGKSLINIAEENDKIVAIVGEGHLPGIKDILEKEGIEFDIIQLKDLMEMKVRKMEERSDDSSQFHMTFSYESS